VIEPIDALSCSRKQSQCSPRYSFLKALARAIDRALVKLARLDERQTCFAGMSEQEVEYHGAVACHGRARMAIRAGMAVRRMTKGQEQRA
jgi:hypothetical protein